MRVGLAYIKGLGEEPAKALVAERERDGRLRERRRPRPAGAARPAGARGARRLRRLRRRSAGRAGSSSGASGSFRARSRSARAATTRQLVLPLGPTSEVPELAEQTPWERMLADYRLTSLSVGLHPLELLRPHLPGEVVVERRPRRALAHGSPVTVAGLVVARQRPATANGVVFMLLEDEHGQMNLIVPPPVYDRYRAAVRGEPLLLARGRFERFERNQEHPRRGARHARAARPPGGERRRGARRHARRAPLRRPVASPAMARAFALAAGSAREPRRKPGPVRAPGEDHRRRLHRRRRLYGPVDGASRPRARAGRLRRAPRGRYLRRWALGPERRLRALVVAEGRDARQAPGPRGGTAPAAGGPRTQSRELSAFCEREGIDAHFTRGGWLWTATSPAQVDSWLGAVRGGGRAGRRALPAPRAPRRCASARGRPSTSARPSSRRLRPCIRRSSRAACAASRSERGVRIFEHSPLARPRPRRGCRPHARGGGAHGADDRPRYGHLAGVVPRAPARHRPGLERHDRDGADPGAPATRPAGRAARRSPTAA